MDNTEGDAVYPLSPLDNMLDRVIVVMGWLVEGTIDLEKLDGAMKTVVSKWPMLGGRFESTGSGLNTRYSVRVPLKGYPAGYETHRITSSVSTKPLSDYITLPLPPVSDALPYKLFQHPQAPTKHSEWIPQKLPLLYWHVTYFQGAAGEKSYSCVGLLFSHMLFDGLGIAAVVHAVEAELLGKPWSPPPLLSPGLNANALEAAMDKAANQRGGREVFADQVYEGLIPMNTWWMMYFLGWCLWMAVWHGAKNRIVLFPPKALDKLVRDTRAEAVKSDAETKLTKGDIVAAFLLKNMYNDGTHPSTRVHCSSLASLRRFFDGTIDHYPHNCVLPLPSPVLTVAQINSITLPDLAVQLAKGRSSMTIEEPLKMREALARAARNNQAMLLKKGTADLTVRMSNMCVGNILNVDWSGMGAVGRPICRYKDAHYGLPISLTDVITLTGYLEDGTLLLDVHLSRDRLSGITQAIERLVLESET